MASSLKNEQENKKPYKKDFHNVAGFIVLIIMTIVCLCLIYSFFSDILSFILSDKKFLLTKYDLFTGFLFLIIVFPFMLWSFITGFCLFFLERKWLYLLVTKPIRHFPTKLACFITKTNSNEVLPPWEIIKNQPINKQKFIWFIRPKAKDNIEKCKIYIGNFTFILIAVYLLIGIIPISLPNRTKFYITNEFATKIAGYKFCYGYQVRDDIENDKEKNNFKVAYAINSNECQPPEEKYKDEIFYQFPS